jgi:hypothetical protein
MAKTIKPSQMADPSLRIGIKKGGMGLRFLHVGKGNPKAIKEQQGKLASCARAAKGLKGQAFRDEVKKCAKK